MIDHPEDRDRTEDIDLGMNASDTDLELLLRRALAREAADVTPGDRLESIRARARMQSTAPVVPLARTPRRPGRLRRPQLAPRLWLPALAAAAVIALVMVAPSVTSWIHDGPVPVAQQSVNTPRVPPLPVYFIAQRDTQRVLVREFVPTTLTDPSARLDAALRLAVAGRAADGDYTSVWRTLHLTDLVAGELTGAVSATRSAQQITVRLDPSLVRPAESEDWARLAGQQLIWTATATAQQLVPVQLVSPGGPARLFGALPIDQPFERTLAGGDPRAKVWINSIVDGQTVDTGTATVTGDAAADSFPVRWTLRRLTGAGQADATATVDTRADFGTPVPNPTGQGADSPRQAWQITLPLPTPGTYLLDVTVDGWSETKTLTVQ
ncbi:MAG: hypothetical protein U0Q19_18805 [Kineosporiaceae bacterium]